MDNDPGRKAVEKGKSVKLKYIRRYQRISVAGLHAIFDGICNFLGRVASGDNRSDLFTKGLQKEKFMAALAMLGMEDFV